MDAEKALRIALELGADEAAAKRMEKDDVQIRFSNNNVDISNRWLDESLAVFIAVNGRTTGVEIKNDSEMKETIEKAINFAKKLPENPDFRGLYDKKTVARAPDTDVGTVDISELPEIAMDAALEHGVKRVSGEIYLSKKKIALETNYNSLEEYRYHIISTVRAFNEEGNPGQASTHAATKRELEEFGPAYVGEQAGRLAVMNRNVKEGREGKYTILFEPLCFGSAVTEMGRSLSAFSVDMGSSFFVDKMDKEVGSEMLTLWDDPHTPGAGSRGFDDEGAPTQKTLAIGDGVLKTYLHSNSTAKKMGTETTGNGADAGSMAGINPRYWQMSVKPGKSDWRDMLAGIDKGLYIANTWYTRYQDHRAGDYSTIPRDGIFYVENGEIKKAWKGVRITENMLNLMQNIRELGDEVVPVDWWGETHAVFAPHALVDNVRITGAK